MLGIASCTCRSPATVEPWEARTTNPTCMDAAVLKKEHQSTIGRALTSLNRLADDSEKLASVAKQALVGLIIKRPVPTEKQIGQTVDARQVDARQVDARQVDARQSDIGRELMFSISRIESHLKEIHDTICDLDL